MRINPRWKILTWILFWTVTYIWTTTTTNFIENWKITIITLFSHPQIAYKLIEVGEAEDILQNKIYK